MMVLAPGLTYWPEYFTRGEQEELRDAIRSALAQAPLFVPRMKGTGAPFSVRMSNCGTLGWVSDTEGGYRYQATHPQTGLPWPPIPTLALRAWTDTGGYPLPPEACLINWYEPAARMGLHQDRDEHDLGAPVVSISLGDTALFRIGGRERKDPSHSLRLNSGDVIVLGGMSRLVFHGIDRIYPGPSTLLGTPGRINLTLRRVTPA